MREFKVGDYSKPLCIYNDGETFGACVGVDRIGLNAYVRYRDAADGETPVRPRLTVYRWCTLGHVRFSDWRLISPRRIWRAATWRVRYYFAKEA